MGPTVGIVYVVAPLVLLLLLAAGWLLTRRRAVKRVSCGRCFYDVEQGAGERCSECGGVLTEVGVLTPAMGATARQPARNLFMVGFTVLPAALLGLGVGTLAADVLPKTTTHRALWRITGAASGLYSEIGVAAEADARGENARLTRVCVRLVDRNGVASAEVCEPIQNRSLYYNAEEHEFTNTRSDMSPFQKFLQPGDVTLAMVRDAAASLNLDPSDPLLDAEFAEAVAAVPESFRLSGVFGVPSAHFSGFTTFHWRQINTRSHVAALPLGVITALLIWLLTIVALRRAHRRALNRRRDAAAEFLHARGPMR